MIGLLSGVAVAVELPPIPERPIDLEAGECEETGVENGVPAPPLPDCNGLVLPISQWQYLESMAIYGHQIERLWQARELETSIRIDGLEWELEEARKPIPFFSRPSTYALFGALWSGAIIVGYHHAITPG